VSQLVPVTFPNNPGQRSFSNKKTIFELEVQIENVDLDQSE
jgi:hypothetical protein